MFSRLSVWLWGLIIQRVFEGQVDLARELMELQIENGGLRAVIETMPQAVAENLTTLSFLYKDKQYWAKRCMKAENRADAILQEARIWKQGALTHESSLAESYQLISNFKGEPGTWNGAEPIRQYIENNRRNL